MKNKTYKKINLLFVTVLSFFIGIIGVKAEQTRPQSGQTFTFDYQFKLNLGDELQLSKDGKSYIVPIKGYKTTDYTDELNLTGEDEIHYKVTELTKSQYEELKAIQDEIDKLDKTTIKNDQSIYSNNEYIIKIQNYVRENKWWCYDEYEIGEILLPTNCEEKYYIVTVDALDTDTIEMANLNWNYHTARVYKVEANKALCTPIEDNTTEENPKTGLSNPYLLFGTIALVSVASIIVSKKKKYI